MLRKIIFARAKQEGPRGAAQDLKLVMDAGERLAALLGAVLLLSLAGGIFMYCMIMLHALVCTATSA